MTTNSKKRVLLSCGTKFHSDYVAYELEKQQLLERIVTAHPPRWYFNRVSLTMSKVKFLPPIFAVLTLLNKIVDRTSIVSKWLEYQMPFWFDKWASYFIGNSNVLIVWAWSALNTMQKMKQIGGICLLEECGSCNQFQNELLDEEYKKWGLVFKDYTPKHIIKREFEEVEIADYILCPSKHVANSFIKFGVSENKFVIIPYGVSLQHFRVLGTQKKEFTVLYVGTVGVRKGIVYLFQALELLKDRINFKCIVIGSLEEQFEPLFNQYKHLFTHIPRVPHTELINYYNDASVFVLPTLDEGMALVQLEAMACGLPVIATTNSGADSIIEDGENGFIVPIRNAEAIVEKIEIVYQDKKLLHTMSINAANKAKTFTWDNYGVKLSKFINSL